jgi:short-subunit dehydrogenase
MTGSTGKITMRSLKEQVVVITGASSGIGRETALEMARRGASVVLAARNKLALENLAREIQQLGGLAHVVPVDVAEWAAVERLAQEAAGWFGRIDTWVNNAAVSAYGTVEQMSVEEIHRIIQVNLMGQVHGMKAALPVMKRQGGGTIINVASVLAERAVPLQAAYVAAKHALKGFTEAFRMELERDKCGVQVTLILPASINTPLFRHARSKIGVKPMPVPPIYEPRTVAQAIAFAAEYPRRDLVVGGAGKMLGMTERISPRFLDWVMVSRERAFKKQMTDEPDDGQDNLFQPLEEPGTSTGEFGRRAMKSSLYTRVFEMHPSAKRLLWGAALAGVWGWSLARRPPAKRSRWSKILAKV